MLQSPEARCSVQTDQHRTHPEPVEPSSHYSHHLEAHLILSTRSRRYYLLFLIQYSDSSGLCGLVEYDVLSDRWVRNSISEEHEGSLIRADILLLLLQAWRAARFANTAAASS
jgi:hypothetical protein